MNNQLVHLHLHTEYSLLDAMNRLKDLAKRAKAMGFEAMAITDHGNMFGVADFSKQMQKAGIKPIIGCEMYIIPSGIKDKRRDNRHVVLLAKNEIGYHNLCMLASIASLDGYYYDARIDHETLEKYSEGLIVLSACLGGDVSKEIKAGLRLEEGQEASDLTSWDTGYQRGLNRALWYKNIFKDDFYLEIQDNGIKEQYLLNDQLIKMSEETGIELVYAGDTHYLDRELAVHHDVYMALGSGTTVDSTKRKRYGTDEFYLKSYDQVMSTGLIPIEAVENTVKIANKVTYMMEFGKYKIPEFKDVPEGLTHNEYLKDLGMKGLKERYPETWEQNLGRLNYELSVIQSMGFNDYFLIVWDFVDYARKKKYYYGPGRGCFKPGSKVTMGDWSVKNIEDLQVGESVITKYGKPSKVQNVLDYDVSEPMSVIKAGGNDPIVCTQDHKILTLVTAPCSTEWYPARYCKDTCPCDCKRRIKQKLEWVEASTVKKGDFLCYPKPKMDFVKKSLLDLATFDENISFDENFVWYDNNVSGREMPKVKRFVDINSEKFSRFAGLYLGNGWSRFSSEGGDFGVAFHSDSTELVDETVTLISEIFGIKATAIYHKTRKSVQVMAYSKLCAKAMSSLFGKGAKNKKIPEPLINSGDVALKALLKGLFDTDGHVDKKGVHAKANFSSTSESLSSQVKYLLARFGIFSGFTRRVHKLEDWQDEIQSTVSGKQLLKFLDEFYPEVPKREQSRWSNDFLEDENYFYLRVQSTETTEHTGKVYDLTIEDDPSFVVNNSVVHNSGAGSILAYCLYITFIDPIANKLLFERFLNPGRISLPDIDWDCDDRNRQDMIRYVEKKYGKENVGQIITFQRLGAKKAPREVARSFGLPYEFGDKISKKIPDILNITIKEALELSPELRTMYETDEMVRNVLDVSMSLEGLPSNPSTHAAGVVIAPFPIKGNLPLWKIRAKGKNTEKASSAIVVQSEMGILEEQGYLKMDFLGLSTLTTIGQTIEAIKRNKGVTIDYEWLLNGGGDCPETYAVIAKGDTEGIFQVAGHGITQVAKNMRVSNFEELTALISIYRPGPMEFIPQYIENKNDPSLIKTPFEELDSILKDTYGILIYQEQVILMVQAIAGYTLAEADDVRKGIGKKKADVIAKHREIFAEKGSIKYKKETLYKYWDEVIVPFGSYCFNLSHGAAYARIAQMMAYLKAFYPVEFMAATLESLNSLSMDSERRESVISSYMTYLKQKNIAVVSPDVQTGDTAFFATTDGRILYGLSSIKGVGGAAEAIVENREKYGPFEDFSEFVNRVGNLPAVNRSAIESIILAGGCDSFGIKRSEALVGMEAMLTRLKARKTCKSESTRETKYPFLGMKVVPTLDEFPILTILTKEKMLCKTYLSGHPLDEYKRTLNSVNTITIGEAISGTEEDFKLRAGDNYRGIVMMESMKEVYTKADKKPMAICSIADLTGSISMPIFNKDYLFLKSIIKVGDILMVEGKLGEREGQPSILFSSVNHFSTQEIKDKVYIKADTVSLDEAKRVILACGRGEHPVILVVYNFSMPLPKKFWVNEDGIEILKKRFSVQLMH